MSKADKDDKRGSAAIIVMAALIAALMATGIRLWLEHSTEIWLALSETSMQICL